MTEREHGIGEDRVGKALSIAGRQIAADGEQRVGGREHVEQRPLAQPEPPGDVRSSGRQTAGRRACGLRARGARHRARVVVFSNAVLEESEIQEPQSRPFLQ